ncbi:MAG: CCA tRNA nucleotidyltransferase [Rhodobacteraceae bacterium]|nr:CCA tRNA nucleotidyltransferase [Paracoccaceae bacterium]
MTRITADWLCSPATQAVFAALQSEDAQVLFVGGCVRNALMGVAVSDIDLSCDLEPELVMQRARKAGIKVVPTGVEHGTVTLVSAGLAHEVTTFRKDIATDGRRAVVAFSRDINDDAARRDFTMNALYASADGTVIDPLGGMEDLKARRVRFIGKAQDRIKEDYLRSLRYFRFHAWYGDVDAGFDSDALAAIAGNLDGLKNLSRERIGAEMLKLLSAPDPAPSLAAMRSTGVLGRILPGADDRALAPLIHIESQVGVGVDVIRRLAVLGGDEMAGYLRLSRAQAKRLTRLRGAAVGGMSGAELGYRLKQDEAQNVLILRCALLEELWCKTALKAVLDGTKAKFPVRAKDLAPGLEGPELGVRLALLETIWIESGFTKTKADLLAYREN